METNVDHIVVEPRPDGRWARQRNGTTRAASLHAMQVEAEAAGRAQAKRMKTELVVKGPTVESCVATATAATRPAGQDELSRHVERKFARVTVVRLQSHDNESMRRSMAIGDQLTRHDLEQLVDCCGELLAERVRIERLLTELRPWTGSTRRAIHDLYRAIGTTQPAAT